MCLHVCVCGASPLWHTHCSQNDCHVRSSTEEPTSCVKSIACPLVFFFPCWICSAFNWWVMVLATCRSWFRFFACCWRACMYVYVVCSDVFVAGCPGLHAFPRKKLSPTVYQLCPASCSHCWPATWVQQTRSRKSLSYLVVLVWPVF